MIHTSISLHFVTSSFTLYAPHYRRILHFTHLICYSDTLRYLFIYNLLPNAPRHHPRTPITSPFVTHSLTDILLAITSLLVQTLEPTPSLLQQTMRLAILDKRTAIQDDHLVEVKYRVEFVRDGDDSVRGELLADEALNNGVGCGVETELVSLEKCGSVGREAYLDVASSSTRTLLLSLCSRARAMQNNWRCPWLKCSSSTRTSSGCAYFPASPLATITSSHMCTSLRV
jgi:hypothetical protein